MSPILWYIIISYSIMLVVITYSTITLARNEGEHDRRNLYMFSLALGFAPIFLPLFLFILVKNELKKRIFD